MILDNSGIDYSQMLLFMFFLFTEKLNKILANSRVSSNTWFTT